MNTKQYVYAIRIMSLITVVALGVSVWALLFREETAVIAPDYAPRVEESAAEPIPNEGLGMLDKPENGSAVSITYSDQVMVDLSEETAKLLFANPRRSHQDMLLQLVIHDVVILQSGRILPGNQVTNLQLLPKVAKRLSAGGYDGVFVISYYDPASGEKALVNTEIPVSVTITP